MVTLYYKSNHDVEEDQELQAWIREVTQDGFAELPDFGQTSSLSFCSPVFILSFIVIYWCMCLGLPGTLSSRKELSTLLAVVIFTCTAQHAATNNGQVPNNLIV